MCNYLYYWVTVRNSQSYWHLEHMRETLACTRRAGWGVGADSREHLGNHLYGVQGEEGAGLG